jgi:hypothetical protein
VEDVGKAGNIIGRHSRQALVNGSGKRGVSQAGKQARGGGGGVAGGLNVG